VESGHSDPEKWKGADLVGSMNMKYERKTLTMEVACCFETMVFTLNTMLRGTLKDNLDIFPIQTL